MHLQNLSKRLFQVLTSHNIIHKTMLYKKLCSLKSLRQFLSDRLLNDTWTCKTNECSWFCQDNVSKHCKACCHTTGRRLCQNTYIKQPRLAVAFQCRRSFCHLHQGCDSLLHSGSTGTGKNDDRKFFFCRTLDCSGDLFTDGPSHARHQESSVADCDHGISAIYFAFSCDNSFFESCLFLKCLYFFRIAFVVYRISTNQILIPLLKSSFINHHLNPAVCMDTEISSTFRTDIISLFYILCNDRRSALVTLAEKPFRHFRSGSTGCIMALYSGNNSCLFEHVVQLHSRSTPVF